MCFITSRTPHWKMRSIPVWVHEDLYRYSSYWFLQTEGGGEAAYIETYDVEVVGNVLLESILFSSTGNPILLK